MKRLGILLISLSVIACQSEKKTTDQTDSIAGSTVSSSSSLTFKYDSLQVFSKQTKPAEKGNTDTAYAKFVYPLFSDQKLNELVEKMALKAAEQTDQSTNKTYKELATSFVEGFDEFNKENGGTQSAWFLDDQTKVLVSQPDYLCLEHSNVSYAGGAHPNSAMVYWNLDPKTLKEITLESLIKEGSLPELNAIAEKIFRKNEKLSPTASLKDNYFFEKDTFALNRNFTITKEGLKFLYNPYEIKAYAYGNTELLIPFSELKAVAKPNTLLSPTL